MLITGVHNRCIWWLLLVYLVFRSAGVSGACIDLFNLFRFRFDPLVTQKNKGPQIQWHPQTKKQSAVILQEANKSMERKRYLLPLSSQGPRRRPPPTAATSSLETRRTRTRPPARLLPRQRWRPWEHLARVRPLGCRRRRMRMRVRKAEVWGRRWRRRWSRGW